MRTRGVFVRRYPKVARAQRVFVSRYPKVKVTYRDGKPWTRRVSRYGGQMVSEALLVPISWEAVDKALYALNEGKEPK